jgi:hypothetical protein
MFEIETGIPASASSAFEDLMALIKLVGDPKGFQRNLDALVATTAKANEAKAAAAKAEASLAKAKTEQEAAFAKRGQELDAYNDSLTKRKNEIAQTKETILGTLEQMRVLEGQMKRAVMGYGGLLSSFDPRLQSMPSWQALGALDGIRDAHMSEDDPTLRDRGTGEIELVEHAQAAASIRRSKPPRSSRADA